VAEKAQKPGQTQSQVILHPILCAIYPAVFLYTANKALLATHGNTLFLAALKKGGDYFYFKRSLLDSKKKCPWFPVSKTGLWL